MMALTRSFRETIVRQVREDPAFRVALVEEAARNLVEGDIETALGQIRDIVNATIGFAALSTETGIPKTSLMRMLSDSGNPRAVNLSAILRAVGRSAGMRISVHVEPAREYA